ncbi:MAG: glycerophosphoryl diester phosphodiesterase [Frankiales bacterium]|nr:glycerophosphoryl diester phosphodiesterase [Frankiales bacterium]
MAEAPENSLAAFRNSLAKGVRALESDIWLLDGVPVLSHDAPAAGTLTLAELFDACGTDFDLSVDMKGPGKGAEETVAVARAAGFDLARLWLVGGPGSCARWRRIDPDIRLVTQLRWRDALFNAAPVLTVLAASGVDAVNIRHGRWTRRLVARVHAEGMLAFGWDVQTRWSMRRATWLGLDGVFSDRPTLLVQHT